jgi:hypothetical protein
VQPPVQYTRTQHGRIEWRRPIPDVGVEFVFQASNVRKQSTGIHATVSIGIGSTILDEDNYNIERRDGRDDMVRAIYGPLTARKGSREGKLPDGFDAKYPRAMFDADLMAFQRGLWAFEVGELLPQRRGGSPDRTPPPWLIEGVALKDAGTIMFAPPGRGKSWTAILMALALDTGKGDLFHVLESKPCLFINLERSAESVDRRLGDANEALGLPRTRPMLRLEARGKTLVDVWDAADRTIKAEGVEITVLDSLTRGGFGNLNDNEPANRAVDGLNALPGGWLALGHTPRGDETHIFGSQMFDAAADLTLQLLTEQRGDRLGVGIKGIKANDVRPPSLRVFDYQFDDRGLVSASVARPGSFLSIESEGETLTVDEQVRRYLLEAGRADAGAIADDLQLDRTRVVKVLTRAAWAIENGKDGRKKLYSVRSEHNELFHGTLQHTSGTHGELFPSSSLGHSTVAQFDSESEEGPEW